MNSDLATQLRRLGLGKGTRGIKPPEKRQSSRKIEELLLGSLLSAGESSCLMVEKKYPLDYLHGNRPLGALLEISSPEF